MKISQKDLALLGTEIKLPVSLIQIEYGMKISNTFFYFYYYFFRTRTGL